MNGVRVKGLSLFMRNSVNFSVSRRYEINTEPVTSGINSFVADTDKHKKQ